MQILSKTIQAKQADLTSTGLLSHLHSRSFHLPLSGSPAKNGPLEFATKNSFPLFFVGEKALVYMYGIHNSFFSNSLFSPYYKQKTNSGRLDLFDGDRKTKIDGFLRGALRRNKCS